MPLSRGDRKDRMPFGAQKQIARKAKVAPSYVSSVMNDAVVPRTARGAATLTKVRRLIAEALKLDLAEVFPDEAPAATAPLAAPIEQ